MGLFRSLFGGKQPHQPVRRQSDSDPGRDDFAYFQDLYLRNFPEYEIRTNVPADQIDPSIQTVSLPVTFLFCRDGKPLLAVLLMDPHQDFDHRYSRVTERACRAKGLPFLRYFLTWRNDADYVVSRTRAGLSAQSASRGDLINTTGKNI